MLTHARLLQVLEYDERGWFNWRVDVAQMKKGDRAGTISGNTVRISIDRKVYRQHRLAWFYVHGKWPRAGVYSVTGSWRSRIEDLREPARVYEPSFTTARKNP